MGSFATFEARTEEGARPGALKRLMAVATTAAVFMGIGAAGAAPAHAVEPDETQESEAYAALIDADLLEVDVVEGATNRSGYPGNPQDSGDGYQELDLELLGGLGVTFQGWRFLCSATAVCWTWVTPQESLEATPHRRTLSLRLLPLELSAMTARSLSPRLILTTTSPVSA